MRLKYGYRKITMSLTKTIYPNRIALHASKKGVRSAEVGALAQCSKNQPQNSNTNKNYLNVKVQYK